MKLNKILISILIASLIMFTLSAFRKKSNPAFEVVKDFKVDRYLGTWYEIARLDFKWEKNLNQVSATYSLRNDDKIKVDNRGYDTLSAKWKQSIGKAKFTSGKNVGSLKVSFFGPFYSQYNVVALDDDYKYALVLGESTQYMWILSREKTIPESVKQKYLEKAKSLGVKTDKLVWVGHKD